MTLDSAATASEIPIALDLGTAHHMDAAALPDGGYEVTTTGEDPYVMSVPLAKTYDPEKQYVLSFEYFSEKGVDGIELFYGPPIRAGQSAMGPELLSTEGWTSYSMNIRACQAAGSWRGGYRQFRLDFGRKAGRTIQLRNVQLRGPSKDELEAVLRAAANADGVAAFDAALQAMTSSDFDARIARVEATDKSIRVTVEAEATTDGLILCEVPFFQSPVGRTEFVWQQPLPEINGARTIEIERLRGQHDRVFSSWILMGKTKAGLVPASHQRFVGKMPGKWRLERDKPKSRKGTVGLHGGDPHQVEDYKALGIHNTTKNILLPNLLGANPGDDTFPHVFNGTTVHVRRDALARLDRSMLEAQELEIVVSAIILIPKKGYMSHPDCTPQGIYAMANVIEEQGWNSYAAGLDFLAQRYTRPDRKYGRMTHWILHNEVDAGWIWTNAGEKPLATYLDLYYRSMRTAQSVIRRYGHAGQVLMSLTHYWTARHNSRCYAPKDLVDLLAKRCAQEGDFDWGLAYHPYPQNLRDPRTWLDKKVSFDPETPLITPKNLEVLDGYMRQEKMLCDGELRTIVLSEQGSNSPGHSAEDYRNQAAGLVYTWLKLQKLGTIESYVHHRWIDHPKEGGLNLGMRRRKETSDENAKAATAAVCRELEQHGVQTDPDETSKPVWDVYRALETSQQRKAVDWARSVIPAQYAEDVR